MKVTYNWLKDFVDIKISAQALADKLTMAGLEVTSLEKKEGDFVFEIEVTSNRPDCLSIMGIARETAAITGRKLKLPTLVRSPQSVVHSKEGIAKNYGLSTMDYRLFSIKIEDKKDCPSYTAKIIRDVKVGPSPGWLKKRLELVGCRSVNNIVDITNYILFEWGQPLHAFDLGKLSGLSIIVRRAKRDEKIITIDNESRILNSDILVIADTEKSIAIAGIMGGRDTEVTERTKNILLEAAVFHPLIVRRNSRRLGIQSDSSYRFERGIDIEKAEKASWQAVKLIEELAGARCTFAKSLKEPRAKTRRVKLEISAVNKILGMNILPSKIEKILKRLEFKISPVRNTKSPRKKLKISNGAKNNFIVGIPSHRADVNSEIDLIEEIARIFGYENISHTLPRITLQISADNKLQLCSLVKDILVSGGLNEVITYSLVDKNLLRGFNIKQENEAIEVLNPLSKEQEVLRPSLMPSIARCIAYNLNQKQAYVNIFEIAKVFLPPLTEPKEELMLGLGLCGTQPLLLTAGLVKEEAGFLHLKGILEQLFGRLGIKEYSFQGRGGGEAGVYINKDKIAVMARLSQGALDYLDIKNKDVFVAEVSLDRLLSYMNLNKKFVHLPVYPGVLRDISLILKDGILAGEALGVIKEKGMPLLKEAKVVDYYKGKQIPSGFKGFTISCLYHADDRTLTEEEILPLHSEISQTLVERFAAQIR